MSNVKFGFVKVDRLTPATKEEADILEAKGWVRNLQVDGEWIYAQEVEAPEGVPLTNHFSHNPLHQEENKQEETKQENNAEAPSAPAAEPVAPSTEPTVPAPDTTTW